jgi:hypothetical protein
MPQEADYPFTSAYCRLKGAVIPMPLTIMPQLDKVIGHCLAYHEGSGPEKPIYRDIIYVIFSPEHRRDPFDGIALPGELSILFGGQFLKILCPLHHLS